MFKDHRCLLMCMHRIGSELTCQSSLCLSACGLETVSASKQKFQLFKVIVVFDPCLQLVLISNGIVKMGCLSDFEFCIRISRSS